MINKEEIKRIIENDNESQFLDYKADLALDKDGDKAEFIKDVIALANSSKISHIITGIEDQTKKLNSINTHHTAEQLNSILLNRCDPPISLEYVEETIFGHQIGIIEIHGDNPPYLVGVTDIFGGLKASGDKCYIGRGTIFIRNNNKNEGAVRGHIEKMYEGKVKYEILESDLKLTYQSSIDFVDEKFKNVTLEFRLSNEGNVIAASPMLCVYFLNITRIISKGRYWLELSDVEYPGLVFHSPVPVGESVVVNPIVVQVPRDLKHLDTRVHVWATNMKTKKFPYDIPLGA